MVGHIVTLRDDGLVALRPATAFDHRAAVSGVDLEERAAIRPRGAPCCFPSGFVAAPRTLSPVRREYRGDSRRSVGSSSERRGPTPTTMKIRPRLVTRSH